MGSQDQSKTRIRTQSSESFSTPPRRSQTRRRVRKRKPRKRIHSTVQWQFEADLHRIFRGSKNFLSGALDGLPNQPWSGILIPGPPWLDRVFVGIQGGDPISWTITRRASRSPIGWGELLSNTLSNTLYTVSNRLNVTNVTCIVPDQSSPTLDEYVELAGVSDWAFDDNLVRTRVHWSKEFTYIKSYSSHDRQVPIASSHCPRASIRIWIAFGRQSNRSVIPTTTSTTSTNFTTSNDIHHLATLPQPPT